MHGTKRRDFTDEVRSPNVDPSGSSASGTTVLLRYFNCFFFTQLAWLTAGYLLGEKIRVEGRRSICAGDKNSYLNSESRKVIAQWNSWALLSCAAEDKLVKRVCLGKESLVEGCSCFLGVASRPEHAVLCEGSFLSRRRRCPVPTIGMET